MAESTHMAPQIQPVTLDVAIEMVGKSIALVFQ